MFLSSFYQESSDQSFIQVSAEQGSRFAKEVAGDFNPLHDQESKRFVVPGDLLFSLVLAKFGIFESMQFKYQGMVAADAQLHFVMDGGEFKVVDQNDKVFLSGKAEGSVNQVEDLIAGFCQEYVAFSGVSFPHILVPQMQDKDAMINPKRPMVIYESMAFHFNESLNNLQKAPELRQSKTEFEVDGKRGKMHIHFDILVEDCKVGEGSKTMTLSGLRPYDSAEMDALVAQYAQAKESYQA